MRGLDGTLVIAHSESVRKEISTPKKKKKVTRGGVTPNLFT